MRFKTEYFTALDTVKIQKWAGQRGFLRNITC